MNIKDSDVQKRKEKNEFCTPASEKQD